MRQSPSLATRPPELAVVVLAHGFHGSVRDAVASLLTNGARVEIVVSHSGEGELEIRSALAPYGAAVRLDHSDVLRDPGAARNAGIAATCAPLVAFLASDCVARPGWAQSRVRRHLEGAEVVSSALVPADHRPVTIAEYLLLHSFRMPHLPFAAGHSGASYARTLFERHGCFPELPTGEDVVFNDRLKQAGVRFAWAPEVVTVHQPPPSIPAMLRNQMNRGRQWGMLQPAPTRLLLAIGELVRPAISLQRAAHRRSPVPSSPLVRALPATFAGGAARALGLLSAPSSRAVLPEHLETISRYTWIGRRLHRDRGGGNAR